MIDKSQLTEFEIFSGFSPDSLSSIAGLCDVEAFKNGEIIFKQEEPAEK